MKADKSSSEEETMILLLMPLLHHEHGRTPYPAAVETAQNDYGAALRTAIGAMNGNLFTNPTLNTNEAGPRPCGRRPRPPACVSQGHRRRQWLLRIQL